MPEVKRKLRPLPAAGAVLPLCLSPSHLLTHKPSPRTFQAFPIGCQLVPLGWVGSTGVSRHRCYYWRSSGSRVGGGMLARFVFEEALGCWETGGVEQRGREGSPGSLPNRVLSSSRLQFLFPYPTGVLLLLGVGVGVFPKRNRGGGTGLGSWSLGEGACVCPWEGMFGFTCRAVSQRSDFVPRGT